MALLERELGLKSGELDVAKRFARLQRGILQRSREKFGGSGGGADFFAAQESHAAALLEGLEGKYGATEGVMPRRLHALRRAILAQGARDDRRVLLEVERLTRMSREIYGGATLTQEQVAECLKQARLALLTKGFANSFHGVVPVAVAARVAHIRAPEPIAVMEEGDLLATLHARLQDALDTLNRELAPKVDPFRVANELL